MEEVSKPDAVPVPPRSIYPGRIDEKGRLKLPVDFQHFLSAMGESKVFITTLDGRIGRIYPISEWARVENQLGEAGEDAEDAEDLFFLANAFGGDADVDSQGRVLVPAELRRKLDVESQAVHLHHYRGHIRIYTDAYYRQKMERAFDGVDDKLRRFEKKGLR